ncbi:MAG: signal peptidase I [Acutalibacteraceae bacterium]
MTDNKIKQQILTVVGIALCVILIPMLIINCTLLIKGWTNNDKVPSVFGYSPMIVLTDSMTGSNNDSFNGGDLIFIKTVEAEEVKKGDVISFFDPTGNGTTITSHRVVEVINENGKISFKTKGDNNNTEDKLLVPSENLVGAYTGFRIAGAGNIAMFMQTPWGLIICVIVPIILLIAWDAVRRSMYNKKRQEDEAALLAELEELRAEKANKEKFESKYNNETMK